MQRRDLHPLPSHLSSSSSSALFDFSAVDSPPTPPAAPSPYMDVPLPRPAFSLPEPEVYRGIDFSSPILSYPASSPSSSFSSSFQDVSYPSHQLKKDELPSPSLSASYEAAPVVELPPVPMEPTYLERYTTFHSTMSDPTQLLSAMSALFTSRRMDHTVHWDKHKVTASFLCPLLSTLTVSFNVRLYRAASNPSSLLVELQRRDGCVVAFNKSCGYFMDQCRLNGLVDRLYDANLEAEYQAHGANMENMAVCQRVDMASLCQLNPDSALLPLPPSPSKSAQLSFVLDASAFAILTNLVEYGDIVQQRDALRLIALSLMSSPQAQLAQSPLLHLIPRWSLHPSTPLDDERTTQLARLMLILTQGEEFNPRAFVQQCAHALLALLVEAVEGEGEMSLIRVRCVRYLVAVLSAVSVKGAGELGEVIGEEERKVLERCSGMSDDSIQEDSRKVLDRLQMTASAPRRQATH